MTIQIELTKARVPVKIWTTDVDLKALDQLLNTANLPIVGPHVAAMPDVHVGIGATVGSVIPTQQAIIPAAVGVDIGCGMNAVRLSLNARDLPDNLKAMRHSIERSVPVGFNQHQYSKVKGASIEKAARKLSPRLEAIMQKHTGLTKMTKDWQRHWLCQVGTLGGGNHFIEICIDEAEQVWIMLHSGSRGTGNMIGRYFINAAQRDMQRHQLNLPTDRDLCYFSEGSELFDDYVAAMYWAQDYALVNRAVMMEHVIAAIQPHVPPFTITSEAINCHHNYVSEETHFGQDLFITRKGAISAQAGQMGIIPGSMGAKSYIVRGLGNEQSFCSCSHGAGRQFSRSAAKGKFTVDDLMAQTAGVECRKDEGVVDEIPAAYKDIDVVMANQADLVEVVHTLKQVICIKG
ncbi:MAG: RtcB family protein [Formosimonas sp.]